MLQVHAQAKGGAVEIAPQNLGVPVHDYWLEHKRVLAAELLTQREELLDQVRHAEHSCLLGYDLMREKLLRSIDDAKADAMSMCNELHRKENSGWKAIRRREQTLFALQQEFNEKMMTVLTEVKETSMRHAQEEQALVERRRTLEEWAESLQRQFYDREKELSAQARKVSAEMSSLFLSSRDGEHRNEFVGEDKHIREFAKIELLRRDDVPRVVNGMDFFLHLRVDAPCSLYNTPVTATYLDGRDGELGGTVVTFVEKDNTIRFDGLVLQGTPGTSHNLLISIPRIRAGSITPLELPVQLLATPEIRAIGQVDIHRLVLQGSVRIANIEPYGLYSVEAFITCRHSGGYCTQITSIGTERNEFAFEFDLKSMKFESWDQVVKEGKLQIETDLPLTKYTNGFSHMFDVAIQSEAYPTFQYPPRANVDCENTTLMRLDVPHGDLCAEMALSDTGTLMATSTVAFRVELSAFDESGWRMRCRIQHRTFVSLLHWSPGGKYLAAFEPKAHAVYVWAVPDLVSTGGATTSDSATHKFLVPDGTQMIRLTAHDRGFELLIMVENTVYRIPMAKEAVKNEKGLHDSAVPSNRISVKTLDTVFERPSSDITSMSTGFHPSSGQILCVGLDNGEVFISGLESRKHLFQCSVGRHRVRCVHVVGKNIFVGTSQSVSVISMKPTWAVRVSPFKPPSPIADIRPSSAFSDTHWILLMHADGNISVLDALNSRVVAFSALKGVRSLTSFTSYCNRAGDEYTITACDALYPCCWMLRTEVRKRQADPNAEVMISPEPKMPRAVTPVKPLKLPDPLDAADTKIRRSPRIGSTGYSAGYQSGISAYSAPSSARGNN